jgi:ATP-dependent RNA helicase DDX55/SPB4
MEWQRLGLESKLCEILINDFNFKAPTPVQKAGIPHFLGNKDICVESCTGSGKTLTFLLPIFHKLIKFGFPESAFAIIISPSRELAIQTFEVAQRLSSHFPEVKTQCLIGGHSKSEDIEKLEDVNKNIIIGTPGRLIDLLETKDLHVKTIEVLILDEADRLLDMGFKDKIHSIIQVLPKQRRTGLFSATMTTDVESLIKAGLRNPVYINVKITNSHTHSSQKLPRGLTNYYTTFPSYYEKLPSLVTFLLNNKENKIIVFFGTCASTNFYLYVLSRLKDLSDLKFLRLHGKMKQEHRERIYKEFAEEPFAVLLTTDLIARGIDFPDINWIVQFDPPQNPDFFVHRIGRTARANKSGESLLFLQEKEDTYINYLNNKGIKFDYTPIQQADVYDELKTIILADREGYEKAQSAFVGYVRYYKEQHLNFIFEFKHLDLGFLAQGFGLLRIPRIQEIIGKHIENFTQSDIDPDTISYNDSKKEANRLKLLQQKHAFLLENKSKKLKKPKTQKNQRKRSRTEKREAKRQSMIDDFDVLGSEEKIIKKIKKGKMQDPEVLEYLHENPHIKTLFRRKKH